MQPTSSRPSGALSNQLAVSAVARRPRAYGRVRFRQVLSSEIDGLWQLIDVPSRATAARCLHVEA